MSEKYEDIKYTEMRVKASGGGETELSQEIKDMFKPKSADELISRFNEKRIGALLNCGVNTHREQVASLCALVNKIEAELEIERQWSDDLAKAIYMHFRVSQIDTLSQIMRDAWERGQSLCAANQELTK